MGVCRLGERLACSRRVQSPTGTRRIDVLQEARRYAMLLIIALALCALGFYGTMKADERLYRNSGQSGKCCQDPFCEGDCGGWGA